MPKVTLSEHQRDKEAVESVIRKYAGAQCMSIPKLAKKAQIAECQIYNRLKDPDMFRRGELRRICKILHIPDDERRILL